MSEYPIFDGDDCESARLMQLAAFDGAVALIATYCGNHLAAARVMLGEPVWGDSRTSLRSRASWFGPPHDVLAGAWRCLSNVSQVVLPWSGAPEHSREAWMEWLAVEVRSWWDRPTLVRLSMRVFAQENVDLAGEAAGVLAVELRERFDGVPWLESGQSRSWPLSADPGFDH